MNEPQIPSSALVPVGAIGLGMLQTPAAMALAAQAMAAVQSRYVMALQRPRDMEQVRVKLMGECRRPTFAKAATYERPVGGEVARGLSIRFIEAAIRIMGNIYADSVVVSEDDEQRTIRVLVTDLETNATFSRDAVVRKTVERRKPRPGESPLATRVNSRGQTLFLYPATEDEVMVKEASLVSKLTRTLAERFLPADIKEDCLKVIRESTEKEDAKDPKAATREVLDAFAGISIMPDEVYEFLGGARAIFTSKELERLRGVYRAIRDGNATWQEIMEPIREVRESAVQAKKDTRKRAIEEDGTVIDAKTGEVVDGPPTTAEPLKAVEDPRPALAADPAPRAAEPAVGPKKSDVLRAMKAAGLTRAEAMKAISADLGAGADLDTMSSEDLGRALAAVMRLGKDLKG